MTHLWLLVKMLVPRSGRKLNVKWHGLPVVHRKLCEHVASAALAPCLMQEACEMIQN